MIYIRFCILPKESHRQLGLHGVTLMDAIPQTDGKRSTSVPYLNENIKEHKEMSLFWHRIWCEWVR